MPTPIFLTEALTWLRKQKEFKNQVSSWKRFQTKRTGVAIIFLLLCKLTHPWSKILVCNSHCVRMLTTHSLKMLPTHMLTLITYRNSQQAGSRPTLQSYSRIKRIPLVRPQAALSSKSIHGLLCSHQNLFVVIWCRRDPEVVWASFKSAPPKDSLFQSLKQNLSHLRRLLSERCL